MSETHAKKISVSLPVDVFKDLDGLAYLSGVSRSALLSAILSNVLPPLREKAISLGVECNDGSPGLSRRYSSASKALIDSYVSSLRGELQHDLFKETK